MRWLCQCCANAVPELCCAVLWRSSASAQCSSYWHCFYWSDIALHFAVYISPDITYRESRVESTKRRDRIQVESTQRQEYLPEQSSTGTALASTDWRAQVCFHSDSIRVYRLWCGYNVHIYNKWQSKSTANKTRSKQLKRNYWTASQPTNQCRAIAIAKVEPSQCCATRLSANSANSATHCHSFLFSQLSLIFYSANASVFGYSGLSLIRLFRAFILFWFFHFL